MVIPFAVLTCNSSSKSGRIAASDATTCSIGYYTVVITSLERDYQPRISAISL